MLKGQYSRNYIKSAETTDVLMKMYENKGKLLTKKQQKNERSNTEFTKV